MENPILYGQKNGCKDKESIQFKLLELFAAEDKPMMVDEVVKGFKRMGFLADKLDAANALSRAKTSGRMVAVKLVKGRYPHWFLYTWMTSGKPKQEYIDKVKPTINT
jgi:hypothetical protein